MTDYEKLSLSLLTAIAQGIGMLMNQSVDGRPDITWLDNRVKWQETLADIMKSIREKS